MSPEELRELKRRVCETRGLWPYDDERWPDYSTDPVASRVLLAEMAARLNGVTLEWIPPTAGAGPGWWDFREIEKSWAIAEDFDVVICLAWLAWREGAKS